MSDTRSLPRRRPRAAYGRDPEFCAFSRTLEAYRDGQNGNGVVILTTDSDCYRYLKGAAGPGPAR